MTDATIIDPPYQVTGNHVEALKEVQYIFGGYKIILVLTPSNELIGIKEITSPKSFSVKEPDFLSKGYHDVSKYYED